MTHFKSTGSKKGKVKKVVATHKGATSRHKVGHSSHKTAGMKHRKSK